MDPVTGLALGRIAAGTLALVRPAVAGTVLGLDPAANPQALYVARLFGSREVALGGLTLLARGPARRTIVAVGIAVDVADAFTAVAGAQDGTVSKRAAASLLGPALGAVAAGVGGLRSRP